MANPDHLAIVRGGAEAIEQWWRESSVGLDLADADLSDLDLSEARFRRVDMSRANLRWARLVGAQLPGARLAGADLGRANFTGAYLGNVNFSGADLTLADVSGAILQGADLSAASLFRTNFSRADLSGARLEEARLVQTIFNGANLEGVRIGGAVVSQASFTDLDLAPVDGLESVFHLGPSSIGVDTLLRSDGKIPDVFLRGAGVPDRLLTYVPSLIGRAFEFYSCFISHSSRDRLFCDRLYADLRSNRVRTWYFPEDATWGEPVWKEIDRSIKNYEKLVVVCSKNSLQSGPVLREIERALGREDREGRTILFPIRIDNYIFKGWEHPRKTDVVSKVVGDFRGWRGSAAKYEWSLMRLLAALNQTAPSR